jgi:hypothetical protein
MVGHPEWHGRSGEMVIFSGRRIITLKSTHHNVVFAYWRVGGGGRRYSARPPTRFVYSKTMWTVFPPPWIFASWRRETNRAVAQQKQDTYSQLFLFFSTPLFCPRKISIVFPPVFLAPRICTTFLSSYFANETSRANAHVIYQKSYIPLSVVYISKVYVNCFII